MAIRLLDLQNGEIVLTEHCYALKSLKAVIDNYQKDKQYLKVFKYLFYLYCPNEEINPCFHLHADIKEAWLAREIDIDFSLDDAIFLEADECVRELYDTELARAYRGIKVAIDKMATTMGTQEWTFGRDGSSASLLRIAERFDAVRQSYKGVYKDLMEEQKSTVRGQQRLAYDSK